MQKRIAFIGLSGPLFYDYANPAGKAPADMMSSPNPILAAPVSLMLLFDELWFLTRSLCPDNLRDSSFVKFVDEQGRLDDLNPSEAETWVELNSSELEKHAYEFIRDNFFDNYSAVLKSTGVNWRGACDNHSHRLKIGPFMVSANSATFRSALFDLFIHSKLSDSRVELIANPYLERLMETSVFPAGRLNFSERIIGPRLINWQSAVGPYQPEIEDLRHHRYLEDYRVWILQQDVSFDEKEACERREAVEREISSAMRKALLEKLDDGSIVRNSALLLGKAALDFVTGGISGHLADAAEAVKKTVETKSMRWQGFLLDLEQTRPQS